MVFGKLVKIDDAGNMVWEKSLDTIGGNYTFYHENFIELSDGNIVFLSSGQRLSIPGRFMQMTKINPLTGAVIWGKRSASHFTSVALNLGLIEMADGGLLGGCNTIMTINENQVFIMRTDANGNTITNQIKGNLYKDANNDCQLQNTETAMPQVSVIAQSGSKVYSTTTDDLGNFSMATGAGDYQISFGQLRSYWDFCTPPTVTLAPSFDTSTLNLGAFAIVNCPELVVSLGSNVFRRCFDNNYMNIQYQNIGTAPAQNAYVELVLDPQLEFLSATPAPTSQNSQVFRFDLGTLPVGASGSISVNFKVNCDAEIGELLCASAHIYPDTVCIPTASRLADNDFCLPVVASYDPNDKTAFIDGKPEDSKIAPNEELEYLIRFQNTGNDTAFNIVIVDTLTTYLDAASVLPGVSSHPYTFELKNGHILRFSFRNILLPDSNTNEVASHGFVKFRVRQNPNNILGNEIKNSAAIYFDFNAPIITNETKLKITIPSRTNDLDNNLAVQIFPVPARDKVRVTLSTAYNGPAQWRMFDATGKLMSEGLSKISTVIDIPRNGQPSGVYYCQFLLDNGQTAFGKVVFE
jgi:uncharacterized repeat protein (TIGR01451 family)